MRIGDPLHTGVDTSLVKAAVQNLVYHGVITIVPIFMYSNVYCLTPEVSKLREDEQLRTSFMEFIRKDPMDERFVSFKDVFRMNFWVKNQIGHNYQ